MLTSVKRILRAETFYATLILFGILNACFFPCLWGNKTLLASAQDAPSILPTGAWAGQPTLSGFSKTLDNGGPGFVGEPWLALTHYQYFYEHVVPLWNPYQGFGQPLLAKQQVQPFYPLTLAALLHVSPRTYDWYLLSRLFLAGICCYLYLRFFVSFWPGIAGANAAMLGGYYVLFINMPQLSVEVLAPAGLLAAEYLLRKRHYWAICGFAILLLMVFLGEMPESALLLLTLVYTYTLFRIVSDSELRAIWRSLLIRLSAATAAGLCMSLVILLPLWEMMHRSFDVHQSQNIGGAITGLSHDPIGLSIFTYVFPLLYGPPLSFNFGPGELGLRNYFGAMATVLVLIAFGASISRLRSGNDPLRPLTFFFVAMIVLLPMKRYGVPIINRIGTLPYFSLVNFPKYEEALMLVAVAVASAFGIERLCRRQVPVWVQISALGTVALLTLICYKLSWAFIHNEIRHLNVVPAMPKLSLELPTALLGIAAVLLIVFHFLKPSPVRSRVIGISFAALICVELSMGFIAPAYYWFNELPLATHNPFAGAPYINEIRKDQGYYRTFARDGLLFPNWASVFRIYDIRDLDAMYDQKYFPFLVNFLRDQSPSPSDLADRFNGTGMYDLTAPLAERLLQLSSVKYIATIRAFTVPNKIVEEILAQNLGHLLAGREASVVRKEFILGNESRDAVGEHPPYERMPYQFHVGNDKTEILHFSYGLDPFVYDKAGDGVEFILEVKDAGGRVTKLFSNYVDPKHNRSERRWEDGQVDLSPWRGQNIQLLLSTTPGPKGDTTYDWAAWSNFYFDGHRDDVLGQVPPFKLIYDAEAKIYRYDNVLPRAAIYHQVALTQDDPDTLEKLADLKLNVFNTVVVNSSALTAADRGMIDKINREAPTPAEAATLQSYSSQSVSIQASLKQDGILVLNDAGYPGWTVEVDGHRTDWINANYMFRGVFLRAGEHKVRFAYRPASFYAGAAISSLTIVLLIAGGLATQTRRHANTAAKRSATVAA